MKVDYLNNLIKDSIMNVLYLDRIDCKILPLGEIENMIKNEEVNQYDLVKMFSKHLDEFLEESKLYNE